MATTSTLSASWVARAISSKYSRLGYNQSRVALLAADYSDLAKQYQTLADQLEYQGKTNGASVGILAGGITKTQVEGVRANTNRIEGSFRRDRFQEPT
jgi:hypothetical protein